jgi:PAS domain S-box-containing protein
MSGVDPRVSEALTAVARVTEERDFFASIVDHAGLLVMVVDSTGRIRHFNRRCEEVSGHRSAEVQGEPVWRLLARPEEAALTRDVFARARPRIPAGFVHHWRTRGGDQRLIAWTNTTLRAEDGSLRHVVSTGNDITEGTRAEQALRETRAGYQLLLEQMPAILWTTDRELRFTSGAGSGLAQLGLEPAQVAGLSMYAYFQADGPYHPSIAPFLRALRGETVTFDASWLGRSYQVVANPFRLPDGEIIGTIGLALDITERQRTEAERDRLLIAEKEARAAAERAIAARDEFLSVAAHELYTPMTSLQLAVQELAAGGLDEAAARRLTELAERQTQRIIALIANLLDVSRIEAGRLSLRPEPGDLTALVRDLSERFAPELERTGCHLVLRAEAPVIGRWDRGRLEQVLTNLLTNAIHYGAGGPIELEIRRDGDAAVVSVSDLGGGIPPQLLPDIFGRFKRAPSARHYGGLGLGLYIARQIIEAHGGRIEVDSEPGRGSTFTITLPLAGPPSRTDGPADDGRLTPSAHGR